MYIWNAGMMDEEVHKAAWHIASGGIILYPTDTVWGIGCDAKNPAAVDRIYAIKQRSDHKSMLVLMNDLRMLEDYLQDVPDQALKILDSATKPTTLIYPGARNLASNLIAADGSLGIRLTSDPFCRQLIEQVGVPLVSTSANISGEASPMVFKEIEPIISQQVDYVVNWRQEEDQAATPSAIIKLSKQGGMTVIRP
jgi:L-threonylcarbamoyladenylate synthase